MTTAEVLAAALGLADADRVEIIEALIESIQPADQPPFDESWRPVIERRARELHSGKVNPVMWSEVKKQAREAAGG